MAERAGLTPARTPRSLIDTEQETDACAHRPRSIQTTLTPQKAFDILEEGNRRFVSNLRYNRNLLQQVNETSDGQYPFAIVLSCIDSRTSAELIFDQGLGDIFSVRIAGNVLNEDILGSMEFACQVAGSKLIVVLGHTKCGAVKGACNHVELGHLTGLLDKIGPAVHDGEVAGGRAPAAGGVRRAGRGREHAPPDAGDPRAQPDPRTPLRGRADRPGRRRCTRWSPAR